MGFPSIYLLTLREFPSHIEWLFLREPLIDGGTPFPMSVSHTIPMLQGGISIQVVMFTGYFHRIHATNGIFTYYLLIYHENNPKLPRYTIKINELYHTWNPNDLYFRRDPFPPKARPKFPIKTRAIKGFQVNIPFIYHGSYPIPSMYGIFTYMNGWFLWFSCREIYQSHGLFG